MFGRVLCDEELVKREIAEINRCCVEFITPLDPVEFYKDEPAPGDAVFSDGTVVQHKTVGPANGDGGAWSSQTEEYVRDLAQRTDEDLRRLLLSGSRRDLEQQLLALIERFEKRQRVTVRGLTLVHGTRLQPALEGDMNERTNYVTAEVEPWP